MLPDLPVCRDNAFLSFLHRRVGLVCAYKDCTLPSCPPYSSSISPSSLSSSESLGAMVMKSPVGMSLIATIPITGSLASTSTSQSIQLGSSDRPASHVGSSSSVTTMSPAAMGLSAYIASTLVKRSALSAAAAAFSSPPCSLGKKNSLAHDTEGCEPRGSAVSCHHARVSISRKSFSSQCILSRLRPFGSCGAGESFQASESTQGRTYQILPPET
mmetsp:Transcript_7735/g.35062  ORF Transcript_7735/g.35062 Transcript_7735/m.35062 type:complete len:215 (-) Transcript_7735:1749-2393(-)